MKRECQTRHSAADKPENEFQFGKQIDLFSICRDKQTNKKLTAVTG